MDQTNEFWKDNPTKNKNKDGGDDDDKSRLQRQITQSRFFPNGDFEITHLQERS